MKPTPQRRKSQFALCSAMLTGLGYVSAPLQAEEQLMLEEVIITATKRESSLMETAAAVSAFDSNTRNELGIDNALDLVAHTPSLNIAPSRVSIRGVGRPNLALGSDPGVGLYWDGVYSTETDIFAYSNFLDIDRVEVLRGPQGTLYGRNSIGGAVNLISTQPDPDQWGGKIVTEVGDYDYTVIQGLASGSVTDKLAVLFAASQIKRDGFQNNVDTGKDYDQDDNHYASIGIKHLTSERWTNTLKLAFREVDFRPGNGYILQPYNTDLLQEVFAENAPDGASLNFPGTFPGTNFANPNQGMTRENPALNDINDVATDFDPIRLSERKSASFISEYKADQYTFKYTGGYSTFDYQQIVDADVTNGADSGLDWSLLTASFLGGAPISAFTGFSLTPSFITLEDQLENELVSHELQVTSDLGGAFNFISGLYYYQSEEDQLQLFDEENEGLIATYSFFGSLVGLPGSPDGTLYRGEGNLETTSYAAYGQLTWDLSDSTLLTLGLRYSYDEKKATDNTFVQFVNPAVSTAADPTVFRDIEDDWNQITWRFGVDHTLSDDHFLYAFVATGHRSGGFNLLAPTDNTAVGTVDPEELLSYELGYKGSFLDNRVNFFSAVYFYDYSDLQVLKSTAQGGVTVAVYENAAEASAWGVETEVMALLSEGLSVSGTWSYNDSEYEDFESLDSNACALGPQQEGRVLDPLCTDDLDLSGNVFPRSPDHKLSLNLTYEWELLSLNWRATTSYQYTGEQYTTAFNNELYDFIDSWDRWDARLSIASPDTTWELTAFIKNIADDREEIKSRPAEYRFRSCSVFTNGSAYLRSPF